MAVSTPQPYTGIYPIAPTPFTASGDWTSMDSGASSTA